MRIGDCCPMTSCNVRYNDDLTMSFKAPKGKQFVFMLLGVEDKTDAGEKMDPMMALRDLGWGPMIDGADIHNP